VVSPVSRRGVLLSVRGRSRTSVNRARVDQIVDIASVFLISITAVLSAICGYQTARWSGYSTLLYNEANANRTLGAEGHVTANELRMVDIGLFVRYIEAVHAHDRVMQDFFYQRFRPEARPAIAAWIATKPLQNPHAPSSPFVMPQYRLKTEIEARNHDAIAASDFEQAQNANEHSEHFLLLTVIFAGVSFLAGISTKMVFPRHLIIVSLGVIALLYGVVRLATLPFR
jgi:hypothetical protein